jgi:hypothetical protein
VSDAKDFQHSSQEEDRHPIDVRVSIVVSKLPQLRIAMKQIEAVQVLVANDAVVGVRFDGRFNRTEQIGHCQGLYSPAQKAICGRTCLKLSDPPFHLKLGAFSFSRGSKVSDPPRLLIRRNQLPHGIQSFPQKAQKGHGCRRIDTTSTCEEVD